MGHRVLYRFRKEWMGIAPVARIFRATPRVCFINSARLVKFEYGEGPRQRFLMPPRTAHTKPELDAGNEEL